MTSGLHIVSEGITRSVPNTRLWAQNLNIVKLPLLGPSARFGLNCKLLKCQLNELKETFIVFQLVFIGEDDLYK